MSDVTAIRPAAAVTARFDLRPLMFSNMSCTMAMMAFAALIGPIARVLGLQPWHAGAAVTVAGILWMLLARAWGSASDRFGRRRVLLLGCAGVAISYGAMSLFVDFALATLPAAAIAFLGLLVGRGAVGAFYAAIPAASHALIADHFPPAQRAGAMAGLGAAEGTGMVLGPAIAALLSQSSLSLPLYVMALLPLLGFTVLLFNLPRQEQLLRESLQPIRLADPRLRRPLVTAFVAMFCVAIAQITVGFFSLDQLGLEPTAAARASGIALTGVGIALILSQLSVRHLGWSPQRLIGTGALISAIGFAGSCLATQPWHLWLCYFIAAAGMGLLFPAFSALAANAVNADEQGSTFGTLGAVQAFGLVLGPLVGSLLYGIAPRLPYLVIGALLLLTSLWFAVNREPADELQTARNTE